jgi:K(+)-stimulated pyrophosphate-energized sodium pump
MSIAVRGNVRTAAASKAVAVAQALRVAFRTGAVTGCSAWASPSAPPPSCSSSRNSGHGGAHRLRLGPPLVPFFMRVGGGIFTKALTWADLVARSRPAFPRTHPRTHTIADNVGDNVGDCAGMAADLFESRDHHHLVDHPASAFTPSTRTRPRRLLFPLIVLAIGIFASVSSGVLVVRGPQSDRNACARSTEASGWPRSPSRAFLVAQYYVHD